MFSIVGTKVLGRKSCLEGVAPAVTYVLRNMSIESDSNLMLLVEHNPDEFKHMRRCPDFPLIEFLRTGNYECFLYLSGGSFKFLGQM